MNTLKNRWIQTLAASVLAVGAGSAQAITLTLPTTFIDAEATFNFSETASELMGGMGVSVSAMGNTVQSADGWSFMMPVTQVTLNQTLLPFATTPVAGEATGSALLIQSTKGSLALSNFELDFKRNILMADLTTAAGTTKSFDVYSFTVDKDLHVSTAGGLSLDMNLSGMMLTTSAQGAFMTALRLPSVLAGALPLLDFGSLDIAISPSLRFGVSDTPFVTAVPELSSFAMLGLGLAGIAFVSRRKLGH